MIYDTLILIHLYISFYNKVTSTILLSILLIYFYFSIKNAEIEIKKNLIKKNTNKRLKNQWCALINLEINLIIL